ncbi:MAG: FliG C-terminal domain-containing protein [Pirellulaceae bacterium]
MPGTSDALRKAAILIDSLDAPSADALLEQMGEQQARRVRAAVLDLDDVTQAEREEVIAAFLGRKQASRAEDDSGVEFDPSLTSKFGADPPAKNTAPEATPHHNSPQQAAGNSARPPATRPFAFLHEATPRSLASLLSNEHPQTAALVVAHVSPALAADVLKSLPKPMQVEVLRRIVDLEEADPEILREVERQMEAMLSDELRANRRRQAGMVAVGAILAAAGGEGRDALLANLASIDESLATRFDEVTEQTAVVSTARRWRRQLAESAVAPPAEPPAKSRGFGWPLRRREEKPPAAPSPNRPTAATTSSAVELSSHTTAETTTPSEPPTERDTPAAPASAPRRRPSLTFDDLTRLDDGALIAVINAAQPEVALLALTGAPERLVRRIARQLPRQEALGLRRRTQQTGPVRLSDIEEARRQLVVLASRMAEQGEIRITPVRRFAAAV